jgi:hypothetical protein
MLNGWKGTKKDKRKRMIKSPFKRSAKIKASFGGLLPASAEYLELQNLYPIVPATEIDRSWWKNMKSYYTIEAPIHGDRKTRKEELSTMKYCPGVYDFSNAGYIVPCFCDMIFYVGEDQTITWKIPDWIPPTIIGIHQKEQIDSCPIAHGKNTGDAIVKISTPWYWETPKGWSTLVTKPFYNYANDFDICPGIVDSDLDNMSNHQLNAFLRFNLTGEEIVFRAGQPLMQLIPFERQNTKLTITAKPDEKQQKICSREIAATNSRFSDNPDKNGITLLNFRDTKNKNYT